MDRQTMIDRLVEDDKQTIIQCSQDGDYEYLEAILRTFTGYENQTLREIIDEYNSRTWEDA